MAEAIVKGALGSLSSLMEKELGLFLSFDQDLKRLSSSLTAIMATLEDAEEKQFSDRSIKDWLQKLKEAAYELDDIMEDCAYEDLRLEYEGVKCCLSEMVLSSRLSSLHPMHLVFRYKIAKRMKMISDRLDEISEERKKFHLIETDPERISEVIDWRQTSSFITEPQLYGREEDKVKIIDFLLGDASHSKDLSVYPIVGTGGLGKTALAQLIFNHEKIVKHFELRIWVCVSEDFSLKRMTKVIIEAASRCACEDLGLEPLQRKLQDLLQGKRYLLVLDDVWDNKPNNWEKLKPVLAFGAKGASILVTTRLQKVAFIMGTITHPHELPKISENDCWELFKHRAFGPNEVEQEELMVIGKDIVKKCGGVPLAAKALGSLLRFKKEKKEWLYVKESNLWSLPHNENENSIMPVLRLSYLNLPIGHRQCFAFCAMFPKDEKLWKQDLIELWMANGFISSNEILNAEDVGDGVWHELYWRSFFQDIERDAFGKVISFKMHDLVHDLAQSVAEEVGCITTDNGATTLSERIHHLSDCSLTKDPSTHLHQVKSLRTYLVRRFDGQLLRNVWKLDSLRALHWGTQQELSSSIGCLKHLRYLNLLGSSFKTLPDSLCKLWNLQILKLDWCDELQKLPNSLIHLKALQKLSLEHCDSLSSLPPQIGKLTSLRSLSMYVVGTERGFLLAELGSLKLNGSLHIKHLGKVKNVMDAKDANMSIKNLKKLRLSWDTNEELELQESAEEIFEVLQPDSLQQLIVEHYPGAHFPQWISSPSVRYLTCLKLRKLPNLIRLSREGGENMFPNVSTLIIVGCPKFLVEEELLQGLPTLKKMKISGRRKFNFSPDFQCLTHLENLLIYTCNEVGGLHESLPHMTALKNLDLRCIQNLESLPDCFGNLPLFHELTIVNCYKFTCLPKSLKRCEDEMREDWPKINIILY